MQLMEKGGLLRQAFLLLKALRNLHPGSDEWLGLNGGGYQIRFDRY